MMPDHDVHLVSQGPKVDSCMVNIKMNNYYNCDRFADIIYIILIIIYKSICLLSKTSPKQILFNHIIIA